MGRGGANLAFVCSYYAPYHHHLVLIHLCWLNHIILKFSSPNCFRFVINMDEVWHSLLLSKINFKDVFINCFMGCRYFYCVLEYYIILIVFRNLLSLQKWIDVISMKIYKSTDRLGKSLCFIIQSAIFEEKHWGKEWNIVLLKCFLPLSKQFILFFFRNKFSKSNPTDL